MINTINGEKTMKYKVEINIKHYPEDILYHGEHICFMKDINGCFSPTDIYKVDYPCQSCCGNDKGRFNEDYFDLKAINDYKGIDKRGGGSFYFIEISKIYKDAWERIHNETQSS